MISVYTAEGTMDAHLVCGLLESEGIAAKVYGAALQGGIGELPVSGLITVRVPEQFADRAQAVISDYDTAVFASGLNNE